MKAAEAIGKTKQMKPASGIQRLVSLAVVLMVALPAPAFAATADYVYDLKNK